MNINKYYTFIYAHYSIRNAHRDLNKIPKDFSRRNLYNIKDIIKDVIVT